MQEKLEMSGCSSPIWRLQRALQGIFGATYLQGESAITAPPLFSSAGRGEVHFWGNSHRRPKVFLWEALDDQGRQYCNKVVRIRTDWVVWTRSNPPKGGEHIQEQFKKLGRIMASQGRRLSGRRRQRARTSRHKQGERITIASRKVGGSEVISKRKPVHVRWVQIRWEVVFTRENRGGSA